MYINENIPNMADNIYQQKSIVVVDYVKDLKTGEIVKEIKHKPAQSMINKATVQVFDAKNGELLKEGVSHNVVNNVIKQAAFLDYFYQRPFARGWISLSFSDRWWDAIYLSDYDGTEDANEIFIQGNILGWAGHTQTYSGTDIRKGNYNSVESLPIDYKRVGYSKFVYDWPTHAGNGTINSVYWGFHNNIDSTGYRCYVPIMLAPAVQDSAWGVDWSSEGDKWVYVSDNQYIYTYDLDFSSNNVNYDLTNQLGTSPKLRGIDYDLVEGRWWIVNNTDKKVYKGLYASTQFTYMFTATEIGTDTIEGLAFINGKVFIHTRDGIYRYTTAGVLEKKFTQNEYGFGTNIDNNKGIWNFKGNSAWVLIAGYDGTDYWYGRCDQDGNLLTKQKMTDGYSTDYMWIFFFVRNTRYENSRMYIIHREWWYWALINGFGAHTKLASPVTKNNTQTMKVTYEFNVDLTQIV
jgi:hypothetical protein